MAGDAATELLSHGVDVIRRHKEREEEQRKMEKRLTVGKGGVNYYLGRGASVSLKAKVGDDEKAVGVQYRRSF
jgi:hypothetical protein